jgi:hypothetical protein
MGDVFLMPYDEQIATHVGEEFQCIPPLVHPGNRLPQWDDFARVASVCGVAIDWVNHHTSIKLHGTFVWQSHRWEGFAGIFNMHEDFIGTDFTLELIIITRELSMTCGQLCLYPDSATPALILEPQDEPLAVYDRFERAANLPGLEPWYAFYPRREA